MDHLQVVLPDEDNRDDAMPWVLDIVGGIVAIACPGGPWPFPAAVRP